MWRQVALPVILMALCWLTVSGSTNFYLQWLDSSYQQVFDEDIASMHAASLVQQEVWRLHAEFIAQWNRNTDWSQRLKSFDAEMQEPLQTLVSRAVSETEISLATKTNELMREYRAELDSALRLDDGESTAEFAAHQDRLFTLAVQISESTDGIRQINDDLLRAHNARRTRISQVV